jgi:hypothetical protein
MSHLKGIFCNAGNIPSAGERSSRGRARGVVRGRPHRLERAAQAGGADVLILRAEVMT